MAKRRTVFADDELAAKRARVSEAKPMLASLCTAVFGQVASYLQSKDLHMLSCSKRLRQGILPALVPRAEWRLSECLAFKELSRDLVPLIREMCVDAPLFSRVQLR